MNECFYFLGNQFAIIEWEEEETASVVPCRHVGCGVFKVGEVSNVWTPQGRYKGRVAASGKRTKFTMHEMFPTCKSVDYRSLICTSIDIHA